ncbi:MAG: hypothetical protein COV52_00580 [Gammaproteobacteria bacterium CG11_big_fil_rev_8_21_14_0_20_46_22]|nr:MAG: hypothetical protein COW05_06400 [Gammaproteobacteria bacterium CG12_big_fil_rev_8_21_14_0_65_46_12]PIR12041.1 MAG: hypothetical protein COV52_00580 [Gammaproteobacteria bacterium CG11_big_fil_rev_8_21_14_0_20_46_22]
MIAIDIHHDIAIVKARVPVGEIYFTDYITLVHLSGKWQVEKTTKKFYRRLKIKY